MGNWRERRNGDLARIRMARRNLDLDDATYRVLLHDLTGHDSATELDAADLARVLAFFRECGALDAAPPVQDATPRSRPAHMGKLRALWRTLAAHGLVANGGPEALDRYVRHHYGVSGVSALSATQAAQVLHTLRGWAHRRRHRRNRPPKPRKTTKSRG